LAGALTPPVEDEQPLEFDVSSLAELLGESPLVAPAPSAGFPPGDPTLAVAPLTTAPVPELAERRPFTAEPEIPALSGEAAPQIDEHPLPSAVPDPVPGSPELGGLASPGHPTLSGDVEAGPAGRVVIPDSLPFDGEHFLPRVDDLAHLFPDEVETDSAFADEASDHPDESLQSELGPGGFVASAPAGPAEVPFLPEADRSFAPSAAAAADASFRLVEHAEAGQLTPVAGAESLESLPDSDLDDASLLPLIDELARTLMQPAAEPSIGDDEPAVPSSFADGRPAGPTLSPDQLPSRVDSHDDAASPNGQYAPVTPEGLPFPPVPDLEQGWDHVPVGSIAVAASGRDSLAPSGTAAVASPADQDLAAAGALFGQISAGFQQVAAGDQQTRPPGRSSTTGRRLTRLAIVFFVLLVVALAVVLVVQMGIVPLDAIMGIIPFDAILNVVPLGALL
jgi:hypothetical protein